MTAVDAPLAGIRILDLSNVISGPMATMVLADQGADVIKVEAPPYGDPTRYKGTSRGGMSALFLHANRNKRSLCLDLKQEAGREIFFRLVAEADALVQNFRPGAVERLGIDYDAVRAVKPDIVYLSISGLGERGPMAAKRVYDPVIQCASGSAEAQGGSGDARLIRNLMCDKATALTAAQALTTALLAAARVRFAGDKPASRHLKVSMLDATLAFNWPDQMMNHTFLGDGVAYSPDLADLYDLCPTRDGSLFFAAASDREFAGLAAAFDRPHWLEDPRFSGIAARFMNGRELGAELREEAAKRSSEDLCELLDRHEVPNARVVRRAEVFDDPQVRANGSVVERDHPVAGLHRAACPAVHFEGEAGEYSSPRRCTPALGQHSDEILREIGFDALEISSFRERGLLGAVS